MRILHSACFIVAMDTDMTCKKAYVSLNPTSLHKNCAKYNYHYILILTKNIFVSDKCFKPYSNHTIKGKVLS